MKRRLLPTLLILTLSALMLLNACSPSDDGRDHTATDAATPSDGQNGDGLPEICENVGFFDDGTFSLRLLYGMDFKTGKTILALRAENTGDEPVAFQITAPLLNGSLAADDWSGRLEPHSVEFSELSKWQEACFCAGETEIRSVSGKVQLCPDYNEDPYAEADCRAAFEREGRGALCDRAMSAEIPPQVLLDNDACRLTLLCLGRDPLNYGNYYGILFAENKTDAELPVQVNGMTVNNRTMNISILQETVPAGDAVFGFFSCSTDDFEEQRIAGVRSASLLILTDKEENTGTRMFTSGGSWYPLTVNDPDETPETPVEEGTVLMDKNGVRIRLLDPTPRKEELYGGDCRFVWDMYAENGTEESIELGLVDCAVDGKTFDTWESGQPIINCEIAPGSSRFFQMGSEYASADTPCPGISGTFRIYELGRTRILFDSEPVTFPR